MIARTKYSKYLLWLIFINPLLSCSNDTNEKSPETFHSEEGAFMVKHFYKDGSIKTEAMYNSDSLLHGDVFGYYPNKKLKVEQNYMNGKKEGLTKGFFQNGEIEYIGQYKNDKKDSTWLWYSEEHNKLEAIESFLGGNHFGGQLEFDKDGHLKWYKFFNLDGLLGKITFNENRTDIEGKLSFVWYNRDTLLKQEEFSSLIYVGIPPGWQSKLDFILIADDNKLEIKECCKIVHAEKHNANQYELTCSFDEFGDYRVKNALEITDDNGVSMYKDTVILKVVIQKK